MVDAALARGVTLAGVQDELTQVRLHPFFAAQQKDRAQPFAFASFRGRGPSPEPLLRQSGILDGDGAP